MRVLRPGTKLQVLGGAAIGLSVATAALAEALGFALDPFYYLLGAAGLGLVVFGSWRKKTRQS